ncbi:DUF2569 family protein [Paenibacillus tarimensis]
MGGLEGWLIGLFSGEVSYTDKSILQTMVGCAIWIPYFLKSKRVRNTFMK